MVKLAKDDVWVGITFSGLATIEVSIILAEKNKCE